MRDVCVPFRCGWRVLLLISVLMASVQLPAQQAMKREYQIKAVFLFNFTQFVQWPAAAFPATDSPLVIAILGEDPFGLYLDETVKGEMIDNHPLVVKRYSTVEEVRDCHILFITHADKNDIRRALDDLKVQPVLTVSDVDGFTKMGGMIRFFNENGRIKLRINVQSVSDAELVVSSKLLRLAEIVSSKNN
jgi:hypothetical protein